MQRLKRHARAPRVNRTLCGLGLDANRDLAKWPAGITCRNCLHLYYFENATAYNYSRFEWDLNRSSRADTTLGPSLHHTHTPPRGP